MKTSRFFILSGLLANFAHCPPKSASVAPVKYTVGVLEIEQTINAAGEKIFQVSTPTTSANADVIAACRSAKFSVNAMSAFLKRFRNDSARGYRLTTTTVWNSGNSRDALEQATTADGTKGLVIMSVITQLLPGRLTLPIDITPEELEAYNCTPEARKAILMKSWSLQAKHQRESTFTWLNTDSEDRAFNKNILKTDLKYIISLDILPKTQSTFDSTHAQLKEQGFEEDEQLAIIVKLMENRAKPYITWPSADKDREKALLTYLHIDFKDGKYRINKDLLKPLTDAKAEEKRKNDLFDSINNNQNRFGQYTHAIQAKIIANEVLGIAMGGEDFIFDTNNPEDMAYAVPVKKIGAGSGFIMNKNAKVQDLINAGILDKSDLLAEDRANYPDAYSRSSEDDNTLRAHEIDKIVKGAAVSYFKSPANPFSIPSLNALSARITTASARPQTYRLHVLFVA